MAKILIVGGGFAGLIAAERLANEVGEDNSVALISPNTAFTFYPALLDLALGGLTREDIQFDLSEKLNEIGVEYINGEVAQIRPEAGQVEVAGSEAEGPHDFDHLLLATGRRLATEKVPGFAGHSHHVLGINSASRFGEAVRNFGGGQIVIGLCPGSRLPVPVCESAFILSKRFKREISEGSVRIKVIFPGSLEEAFGGARLHTQLEEAFKVHNIDLLYDVPIVEVNSHEVISADKHRIKHDLLMLLPPFKGSALARDVNAANSDDFVEVDDRMRVRGSDKIFAAGDLTALPGPKFAHMAVRQGIVAAENILAQLRGSAPNEKYLHEIQTVIDAGGPESIYLRYGIWNEEVHRVHQGRIWGWAKDLHDRAWRAYHR